MITQIIAILKDSYNLLKSGKLFWMSFALIALFGIVFLSIGNNDKGLTLFFGLVKLNLPMLAEGSMGFKLFYFGIFDTILIGMLLTWIVPILGLISTSTLFPDFMKEGSIDIALSKPISRTKLFTLKYLGGLLFVLLQVSLFSVFLYLCLGIRLNYWSPKLFLVIPIVTLVFSYLYAVNVFWGVLTKTPIISLTLTLMFWFLVWGIQNGEELMNRFTIAYETRVEQTAQQEGSEKQLEQMEKQLEQIKFWHSTVYYIHLAFPKIQETTNLVGRYIVPDSNQFLYKMTARKKKSQPNIFKQEKEINDKLQKNFKARSLWYVIGSSLVFELMVFSIACWLFSRRDY
jgi:ABC-type transport system involved in multi-copper enzyme maturation permease subunit